MNKKTIQKITVPFVDNKNVVIHNNIQPMNKSPAIDSLKFFRINIDEFILSKHPIKIQRYMSHISEVPLSVLEKFHDISNIYLIVDNADTWELTIYKFKNEIDIIKLNKRTKYVNIAIITTE